MQCLRFTDLDTLAGCHVATTRLRVGESTCVHTHDFPEVFLTVAGAGWHCCNATEARLQPGELIWIAPADAHGYRNEGARGLEFINLAFSPGWWRRFCALWGHKADLLPVLRGPAAQPQRIAVRSPRDLERMLRSLLPRGSAGPAALIAAVAKLVQVSIEQTCGSAPAPARRAAAQSPPPAWLARLRAEMTEPRAAIRALDYWQQRSGRSPEHLARSCREYFGTTPTELLLRSRIERAQALLLAPDAKVAAVALDTGFQNLGYFYRSFRRLTGLTPAAWMRRHRGGEVVPRVK